MSIRLFSNLLPIRTFVQSYPNPKPVRQLHPAGLSAKLERLNTKLTFEQFQKSEFKHFEQFKLNKSLQLLSGENRERIHENFPQFNYLQFLRFLIGKNPTQSSHKHLPILNFVYLQPPRNFKPKMDVAGCFVVFENRFLFLKQQPSDSEANTWGVPGGKIAQTENALTSCMREVYEETGLVLKDPPRFLHEVYIRLPEMDFTYKMFETKLEQFPESIKINSKEHTEYSWMTLPEALTHSLIRGEDECILLAYWNSMKLSYNNAIPPRV